MNLLKPKEPQEYLSKILPFKKITIHTKDIDIEMLEEANQIMAKAVKIYGNRYLPVFIRIHTEIERRKKELTYREIALQIASNES